MECRISLDGVSAENGQPSILYQELLATVGNETEAQLLYAVTETEDFKNTVISALKGNKKAFDSNGEIKPIYVIQYVSQLNRIENTLSTEDMVGINNVMATVPSIRDSKQLYDVMEKAFIDQNGLFNPTIESLMASGLYSRYEAANLVKDIKLQETVAKTMDRIRNSPVMENSFEGSPLEYADREGTVNGIGKLSPKNPYEEKNRIVQQYGGLEDIDYEVDNIENASLQKELQNPATKEDFLSEMKSYRRIPNMVEEEGELVPYVEKSIKANAIKMTDNQSLIADLEVLKGIDESLLYSDEAVQYVIKIEKDLASIGVDITGLHALPDYLQIVEPLQNFLLRPNKENTKVLEDTYNEMFSVDTEPRPKVIATDSQQSLHYIETDMDEGQMFENGYIKTGRNNIYQKVQKLSLSELRNLISRTMSQKEIANLLDTESVKLKEVKDNETARQITAYKTLFGHPITTVEIQENISDIEDRATTFDGDQNYLMEDFVADFNVEMIKEKQKDSTKYKEFYSKFGINEKGIYLKSEDPLTVANIRTWLESGEIANAEDITNYSILSKNIPVLGELINTEYPTKETKRTAYANNPNAAPLIKTPYTNINHTFITVENATEDFVRTSNGTYEMVETKGNTSIYAIIPSNENKDYYDLSPRKSFASEDLSWTQRFNEGGEVKEGFVKEKSLLSKEEREKISEENFDCL